ncbi:MAG TPA: TonB-dependent receptor [Acidobacteriaceae bacterium]|nr:TonB-dependent receptor [Acidobacteriaceae bacterium]
MNKLRCSVFTSALVTTVSLSAVCLGTMRGWAQSNHSTLTGSVVDASGKLLPGTKVTAVMDGTGQIRTTLSTDDGVYTLANLMVGNYVVTFEHEGFAPVSYGNVVQTVAHTQLLNAHLPVSGSKEFVEVSASEEALDRNSPVVTGLIERRQAKDLPLNGRNWASLTAYIPGAVDTGGSNQRSIRFAGRGLDDSNFTYDGVDATNVANQTQRAWARLAIPLDAIAEFRVDTALATAEEGATGGAQLAVASPSGTNEMHGRLFEFFRNNIFDAPQPLWASNGETQQPLRLNQFGGSLGGPIVHDKTFFFLASETYRQVWGYPTSGDVPSAAFRATIPTTSPVYAIVNAFPGAGPKTLLTPYTQANDPGDPSAANYDLLTCACTQVVNENAVMLRVDQHFSPATSGFARFNYDRSANTQPVSAAATDVQQRVTTPVNGAVELLHVFSPYLTNEVKFGYNRSTSNTYNSSDTGSVYQIVISAGPGPGFVPENYTYNSIYAGNTFSEIDDLTWLKGRQTWKAGVEIREIQLNQHYGEHGTVTFATLQQLAANQVRKASLTGALPVNDLRKTWFVGYVQDEYKATPNLTLNLGVRYTVFDLFHEAHGKANPFDFDTCGPQGFCGVGASFGQQNYGDVDPRVGFSWSPAGSGKPILRAGFGMYHEDGQLDDQNLPAKNEVPSYSLTSSGANLSYPVDPFFTGSGTLSPNAEQRNRKDSYTEQWDLSLQEALPANFVATLTHLGTHGVHLLDTNVVNLTNPATGMTQYASFAPAIGWRGSVGASSYNGLIVSMRRPFAHGLLVAANYTYAHELDNGSNGSGDGDEISPQNPLCLRCEWASGAWDARHVVNGNAVYELPFGHGKPMLSHGAAGAVLGDWKLMTTALARTGFPLNVLLPSSAVSPYGNSGTLRPNRVPGVPLTPPGGRTVGHWINAAAFAAPVAGTFGNAPRDLFAGPGTWQVDTGLSKLIALSERARLEFRSEFYNVFNHPQLGQPQVTFNPANTAGFGAITSPINLNTAIVSPITPVGSGTPREIQFALRLEF